MILLNRYKNTLRRLAIDVLIGTLLAIAFVTVVSYTMVTPKQVLQVIKK